MSMVAATVKSTLASSSFTVPSHVALYFRVTTSHVAFVVVSLNAFSLIRPLCTGRDQFTVNHVDSEALHNWKKNCLKEKQTNHQTFAFFYNAPKCAYYNSYVVLANLEYIFFQG